MRKREKQFRKGAASFYIVAISTLILLIVATSFAAVIISEIERSSNDDLSQSAYDSAMAGIEDAKVTYYNYQNCKAGGGNAEDCNNLMNYVESPIAKQECDGMAELLYGGGEDEWKNGVPINEGENNNMQQAYTCVKMSTVLGSYEATLSSSNPMEVIKVKFKGKDETESKRIANYIDKIKISWYADTSNLAYTNFSGRRVVFPQLGSAKAAAPPTISVAMVQTANEFTLSDFEEAKKGANETDRGMVYMVPTNIVAEADASHENSNWTGTLNEIEAKAFWKSNDKTSTNLPYTVYCPQGEGNDYACTATIELPRPVGNTRNADTFLFVVSLPYGKPDTAFSMEFFCEDNQNCAPGEDFKQDNDSSSKAYLDGVQVEIDSTGRANDLYRRVVTRLKAESDSSYLSIMGPLELSDGDDDESLKKDMTVTCEYNFSPTC